MNSYENGRRLTGADFTDLTASSERWWNPVRVNIWLWFRWEGPRYSLVGAPWAGGMYD